MTFEAKLIAYIVAAIVFVCVIGWSAHTVDAWHYDSVALKDKDVRNQAIQAAQDNVIKAQAAQKRAEDDARELRAKLDATNTVARDAALGSLRNVQTAIHTLAVSASMANTGGVQGRGANASSDPELAAAIGRLDAASAGVNEAVAKAISAAQHDSANFTSIIQLEPKAVEGK